MKNIPLTNEELYYLSKSGLFHNIEKTSISSVFSYLEAYKKTYQKGEVIQRLGESFLYAGIVVKGSIEGSFVTDTFNKIAINHFHQGKSYGEALASIPVTYSPIQLYALEETTIIHLRMHLLTEKKCDDFSLYQQLSTNLIRILSSQNVFTQLKLRIASQKLFRNRILIYLHAFNA